MKNISLFGFLFFATLLISGCAGLARTPETVVLQVVASSTPTEVSAPTVTPEPTPTIPASATPSYTPSNTPTPTRTPLPTATPLCIEDSGRLDAGTYPSQVLARGQAVYTIYLPPCYDTRLRYPTVYLLHGSPFNERHWLDLGLKEVVDQAISSQQVPPFIVVLPRGDLEGTYNNTSGGNGSFEQVVVAELIPYIDTVYNTLATKEGRVIGGISRGGVWALEIAFRNPDLFAAVGGHSTALSVSLASPAFDPLEIARGDQAPSLLALRIFLDAGDTDWARPGSTELHDILDASGIPNFFQVGSGGHTAAYWTSQMSRYVDFYATGFVGLISNARTP